MDRLTLLESMLIRDLRALAALAERKHFAKTAEELGMSQPSLSAIVKKFETIFGVTLFARTSRRFSITPEGDLVLRQVRSVLDELNALAHVMDNERAALQGRFRLGIIPTLGPYYLPRFLGTLRARYPALELVLLEAKTETLLNRLRQRELDAALLALPVEAADLEHLLLFREPFTLAAPSEHPLAQYSRLNARDVPPEELLILEQGNCLSDQTLDACGARLPSEVRPIHATSLETLRGMVAMGVGVAVLPRLAVPNLPTPDLPVRYLRFRTPEPARVVSLTFRRHGARLRDVQALADHLRAHLPEEVTAL